MKSQRSRLTNPWLHLVLILLIASFFRLWQIGSIPPGLFGDEATDGLDALDVLAGRGAIFFPANFGREGLHMWVVAGAFRLLGVTPLALRLPSVVAGILTALATYWLGRELLAARQITAQQGRIPSSASRTTPYALLIPLLAALYIATSYWHVHFSRFGIRGVFTPLCGALAFAAFWRGVNQANRKLQVSRHAIRNTQYALPEHTNYPTIWFALSGFFLGLATHFYTASRFFPFFLGGFLVLEALIAYARGRGDEAILRRHFWGIVLLYAVAALIFTPLGLYFWQHPGSFAQRASKVSALGNAQPWTRMGQAALANVLQFFVPGQGDRAQFYNLPGRAVFDPLTAILALIGIGALLWRWKQPAVLFLLTWFPALLLPSFLATDRFPTLPRVLGVIPGVYFFPAVGLAAVASALVRVLRRRGAGVQGRRGAPPHPVALSPCPLRWRFGMLRNHLVVVSLVVIVALLVHAGLTYHAYFRIWGPSPATFDAFEGDMTAAWHWLETHEPAGHVYLSSDIYRHPTFMLLGEHATVTTYFQRRDPNLSWFDARSALPLPPPGKPATYLLASSSPPAGPAVEFLAQFGVERDRMPAPDGTPALTVVAMPENAWPPVVNADVTFTRRLTLTGAGWEATANGTPYLWLLWHTAAPDPSDWTGYRLEVAAGDWQAVVPFDAFRPAEWVEDGRFVSWHRLNQPGALPESLRLRLIRVSDGQPVVVPGGSGDGWHEITVVP